MTEDRVPTLTRTVVHNALDEAWLESHDARDIPRPPDLDEHLYEALTDYVAIARAEQPAPPHRFVAAYFGDPDRDPACGICRRPFVEHREQPAPPLDVERLTTVLIEAEADDMLGSEYMPSRLAKYIAARLGPAPSRSEPEDDPISDSRQPEDGPPPGRWPR